MKLVRATARRIEVFNVEDRPVLALDMVTDATFKRRGIWIEHDDTARELMKELIAAKDEKGNRLFRKSDDLSPDEWVIGEELPDGSNDVSSKRDQHDN